MKRICLALCIVALSQSNVSAQRLGDGTFLRRIFGVQQQTPPQIPNPAEAAKTQQEALDALRKQKAAEAAKANPYARSPYGQRPLEPTPAQRTNPYQQPKSRYQTNQPTRPSSLEPTPARRPSPYPYGNQPRQPQTRTTPNSGRSSSPYPTSEKQSRRGQRRDRTEALPPAPKPKRIVENKAFGMTVRLEKDKVVVVRLDKKGTAADAGLKTGDVITSIGSMEIEVPNDVSQFDSVLKPGDQVEFEYARKGKEDSILVPYQRKLEESELNEIAKKDSDTDDLLSLDEPTIPTSRTDTSELRRLHSVIQKQQEVITRLQAKLERLESPSSGNPLDADPAELLLNAP